MWLGLILLFQPAGKIALCGRVALVGGAELIQHLFGGGALVAVQLGLADASQLAAGDVVLAGTEDTTGFHSVSGHASQKIEVHASSLPLQNFYP